VCFGLKSLKFIIEKYFFAQNFNNTIFGPVNNFKQASKQKRMVGYFLEI
jgi:hypothetical protein